MKEIEKIEKYQDLARELRKLWNMKVSIIPVIVGALGTTPKNICKRMEDIGIIDQDTGVEENHYNSFC